MLLSRLVQSLISLRSKSDYTWFVLTMGLNNAFTHINVLALQVSVPISVKALPLGWGGCGMPERSDGGPLGRWWEGTCFFAS